MTFGLSFGTTWQDANCRRLKNSRQLMAMGYDRAATALLCVDADVRRAMDEAGTPCPSGGVVPVAVVSLPPPPPAPVIEEAPAPTYVAPPTPPRRHRGHHRDGQS